VDKRKVWNLFFKEELEHELDANLPENIVRAKVKKERAASEMRRLKGGPVFDVIEKQIKSGVLATLMAPATTGCGCPTCQTVRSLNTLIELWIAIEKTIEKGDK
jgi:hypothetical protein